MDAGPKKLLSPISKHIDLAVVAALLLVSLSMSVVFFSPYLYEWDSVQFALAIGHFNIAAGQPQAPGYPVYVFLGMIFNVVFSDKALALDVMSIIFGALSGIFTYLLARELFGRKIGFISALLLLLTPAHILFSNVAMSDIVSICLIEASIYLLFTGLKKDRNFLLGFLLAGITIGVRPQHFIFLFVLLAIFLFWKKNIRLGIYSLFLFGAGIITWAVPLLALSGGPMNYYILLNSELTGIVRFGISLAQFKSMARRMYDGWTPVIVFFSAIAIGALLLFINENKNNIRGKILVHKPFILLAAWVTSAILSIMAFENLYTVRYLLPVFAPVSIIFAYGIVGLGNRISDKRAKILYYSIIALSVLVMSILSFSLVNEIQSSPPAPVQAANYISEHYSPEKTLIVAEGSYRHFQYYLPGYTILYHLVDYGQVLGAGKPLIVSESPMTLDNSTPVALYQKDDILNNKHLSVGLYEAKVLDHLFVDEGFYPIDFLNGTPIRWTSQNATIIYNASSDKSVDMDFEAFSFNEPRTMQVSLNGKIVHEQYIPEGLGSVQNYSFTNVTVPLSLKIGENIITIHSPEGPQRPCDVSSLSQGDTRELCFALRNVTVNQL